MNTVKGKKQRLADFLLTGFFEKLLSRRKLKHLSILAYHSIQPIKDNYPFNPEIISADPETFRQQMMFVKKYFNVINFHQLEDLLNKQSEVPPNTLIITFDDGYSDNFHTMFPILQELGLTACIYIATDYIDQNKVFWFDELAYIIRKLPLQKLTLNDGDFSIELKSVDREEERRTLGRYLQTLTDEKRLDVLEELRSSSKIKISQEDIDLVKPLTWNQVKTLKEAGFEIGSHSRNHGFLDQMTIEQLSNQIIESKKVIESSIGCEVKSFSYPNGNFDQRVVSMVEKSYPFAVSYDHAVPKTSLDPKHLIPRIHVETDVDLALFKANLLLPEIFLR